MEIPQPPRNVIAPPGKTEVVVIGGGIIGLSAALALSNHGVPNIVLEKGVLGGEQSRRNWGWLTTVNRSPAEIPLNIDSLKRWRKLHELTGQNTSFVQRGTLVAFDDENELGSKVASWPDMAREFGIELQQWSRQQILDAVKGLKTGWARGYYVANEGSVEPQAAVRAIAKAARERGSVLVEDCAARRVETLAGDVSTVVTEKGPIECKAVLVAGGAWSRLFCVNLGLSIPQLWVKSSVLRTGPVDGPDMLMMTSEFAIRKRSDGGYTVSAGLAGSHMLVPDTFRQIGSFLPALKGGQDGVDIRISVKEFVDDALRPRRWKGEEVTPFEKVRVLDPAPETKRLAKAMRYLREAIPHFQQTEIEQEWAGFIDVTPDALPIISPLGHIGGFYVATGFSGHGLVMGPGGGNLAAELIMNVKPSVDPSPFSAERFRHRGESGA